jgi:hypothetical protein
MDERRQRMLDELARAKGRSSGVPKPDFGQLSDVPPDLRADTLTNADPESWANWLSGNIAEGISHGAPDATDRRVASFLTGTQVPGTGIDDGRGIGVADFVPFLGEALSADDAGQAYKRGDTLGTVLGAAGAIVPAAGKFAKKGGKAIAETFEEERAAAKGAKAAKRGGQFDLRAPSEKFEKATAEAAAKKEAVTNEDYDPNQTFPRTFDPGEFHSAIGEAKAARGPFGAVVEQKSPEDYASMMTFLSPDKKTGFAIDKGDLVSVFSHPEVKGRFDPLMQAADAYGARKLDAFDTAQMPGAKTGLPDMYGRYGFQETGRDPWNDQYAPGDWNKPAMGTPEHVNMEKPQPPRADPGPQQQVDGTWGDPSRPDVMFEGVSPHQFSPGQWGRFGKQYGAHNIGPEDEDAWYAGLQEWKTKTGRQIYVPGGDEPFTYFDDLTMKSQGINPNELTPEQHLAIHNRTVSGKRAPPGGFSDEQIFNQLNLATLSPNNPLTPNEFATAASMSKGPEDIDRIAGAAGPDYDFAKGPSYLGKETPQGEDVRRDLSNQITGRLGIQGSEKGGTGVSGNADYTALVDLAQMMKEKPGFFRFRGAGEGAEAPDQQWANFVDRLMSQQMGLGGKTGSFGAVWQDPEKAATSAMDRHMLTKFRDKVFETPEQSAGWESDLVQKWNAEVDAWKPTKKQKTNPRRKVNDIDSLRKQPGGTNAYTDAIMNYVNKPKKGNVTIAGMQGPGNTNPNVPEHLRPENADWVKQPEKWQALGPAYKRGLGANRESAEAAGATGVFSDQWRVWDKIRNRFEPHEIMQPGLSQLPRMSPEQQAAALKEHADLGYLNYSKDAESNLQPVHPSKFQSGQGLTPDQKRMRAVLAGLNPSKLAYFVLPLLAGAGLGGGALRESERGNDNAL